MGRPKNLTVVCDLGTSLNKVLYSVGRSGVVKHLTTGSEYLKLDANTSQNFVVTTEFGKPEDNCWVDLYDGGIHLVGRLADENRGITSIKSLKYESVVPKILAILGSIAYKEKLVNDFSVKIAILLPYGEISDSKFVEEELNNHIKKFKFQGTEYAVNLQICSFIPEGFGILSHFLRGQTKEIIQNSTLAVLMFGYRNTSLLIFENGTLNTDKTCSTDFGFYNLCDSIIKKSSGLTRKDIQASIYTENTRIVNLKGKGEDVLQTKFDVEQLVKTRDPQRAKKEKQNLINVIDSSKAEYWQLLSNWLDESLPSGRNVDNLIYTGGTADIVRELLQNYLKMKYSKVNTSGTMKIEAELLTELNLEGKALEKFEQQHLPLRFTDSWGYFLDFSRYSLRNVVEAA